MTSAFLAALGADGPSADRAGKMDLYGRFVGSWDLDVTRIPDNGTVRRRKGEWHFGWALEGRAIQDVWIVPPRGELRSGDAAANANSYGTTLRVYDPDIDAWRIQWTDPVTRSFLQMIGRAEGARRHRAIGHAAGRAIAALELFGSHAGFVFLAWRTLRGPWRKLADQRRVHSQARGLKASVIFLTEGGAAFA
jgi:hypothetical protein